MKNKIVNDFTSGNILKHLISFSAPMLIGNVLQISYSMVDSILVGRFLGTQALASISVCFPIIFILISFIGGISMATTVLISQYVGASNDKMTNKTIINSFLLLGITGIIASIIGILFSKLLLRFINVPHEIIDNAYGYLNIYFSGLVFVFAYNVVSAIFRGLGDSRTPLKFLIISIVVNIILNPLLMLGIGFFPRMGVNGTALATIISQGFACICAILYLKKRLQLDKIVLDDIKIDVELTKKILKIGLPTALQQIIISTGYLILSSMVNSFGTSVVASYGVVGKLDKFVMMPAMSISLATSSMVGQNIGADKEENVYEIVKSASLLVGGIAIVITILVILFPRLLIELFIKDQQVITMTQKYLRIMSLSYIPFSLSFVTNAAIKGTGNTFVPMVFSIISLWMVRVPLAKVLIKLFDVNGIWIAIVVSSIIGMIMSRFYFEIGNWKNSEKIISKECR